MTQDYYGTKRVTAWPQTRGGQTSSISPVEEGYAVKYADGYTSWSPKEVFEAAYQPIDALNYGHALCALTEDLRVARAGWNGKGMFVWLEKGSAPALPALGNDGLVNGVPIGLFEIGPEGSTTRMPHLCMRAADGSTVTGWLASQTDMLAEDWTVLPG